MISVYNETKQPWEVKNIHGKTVSFSRKKEYNRKVNGVGRPVKKSAQIIGYTSLFPYADVEAGIADLSKEFQGLVKMDEVKTVMGKDTTIFFNNKAYDPYIAESTENSNKDIFLITIDLKGRQLVNITSDQTFILECFLLGGELTLIASLNDFDKSIGIKLYDNQKKQFVTYNFFRGLNSENIPENFVEIDEEDCKDDEEENSGFVLRRFRPAKATYIILCHSKDREQLDKILSKSKSKHEVIEYTKNKADEVIEALVANKFTAVTAFINTKSLEDDVVEKFYTTIREHAPKFRIFYDMLMGGKVVKSKF